MAIKHEREATDRITLTVQDIVTLLRRDSYVIPRDAECRMTLTHSDGTQLNAALDATVEIAWPSTHGVERIDHRTAPHKG